MSRYEDDRFAQQTFGLVMEVVVTAVVFMLLVAIYLTIEVAQIYREHGDAAESQQLWYALACLLAAWGTSAALVVSGVAGPGLALAAWSLLAYIVYLVVLDARLRQQELAAFGDPNDLSSYLETSSWQS